MNHRHLATLLFAPLLATGCGDFATAPDRTPAELRVTPDSLRVVTGEIADFQVELVDENGDVYATIPSWSPPLWTSNRPDRVDLTDGRITPLLGGEQTLHVELAGLEAKALLRANPAKLGITVPMVHVTQSVQRTAGDVPLIAGRDGLLRVVVNGDDENYYRPRVRATFYHGESAVYSAEMALVETDGLPTMLVEGNLFMSYNAAVPGEVIHRGVSVAIEVDPEGEVPAIPGSTLRVPEMGTLALEVREVPPFRLMLVPVEQLAFPDRKPRFTPSYGAQMLRLTNDIFPFDEFDVRVRDTYVTSEPLDIAVPATENTSARGWYKLIEDIRMLRWDDGSTRYYYAGFDRPPGTTIGGLGYVGYPVAIGMDNRPDVIAHELGHTLSLPHAPCGGASGADPSYPYGNGIIGQYGYDRTTQRLQDREQFDLMSYCNPIWISDYNYEKVLAYRDTSPYDGGAADGTMATLSAGKEETLLIRGGVLDGELRLEPALEWDGRVEMPARGGRYTLEGLDAGGAALFTISFEPDRLDHLGGAQFLLALPARMAATDRLERLRLAGPEGVVERARAGRVFRHVPEVRMDGQVAEWDPGAFPLAVVRDRRTGLIRAMSRTGTVAVPESSAADFEVLLSDGLATRQGRVVQR